MTTHVSTAGEIALPDSVRHQLGIQPGDPLDVEVEGARIVLTPTPAPLRSPARIIEDPVTGLPVLTRGPGSPIMTQREVEEILADFP